MKTAIKTVPDISVFGVSTTLSNPFVPSVCFHSPTSATEFSNLLLTPCELKLSKGFSRFLKVSKAFFQHSSLPRRSFQAKAGPNESSPVKAGQAKSNPHPPPDKETGKETVKFLTLFDRTRCESPVT